MKKIIKVPTWSELSIIGKNRLVIRTYLFLPLVPFLISVLNSIGLSHVVESIPFSWKVFFWCALFFTVGSFIYQLSAPKIIRENRTWFDFETAGKTWNHLMNYLLDVGIDFMKWREEILEIAEEDDFNQDIFIENHNETEKIQLSFVINASKGLVSTYPSYNPGDPPETTFQKTQYYSQRLKEDAKENTKHIFWKTWEYADNYRSFLKSICALSFCIGFLLLAWLLIHSAWVVLTNTLPI